MENTILKKGTELHTITSDINYVPKAPHYASYLEEDIKTYQTEFPKEIFEREGYVPVYDVITVVNKDISVCSVDFAKWVFDRIYAKNTKFSIRTDIMLRVFSDSIESQAAVRTLNQREQMVRELLKTDKIFDAFMVSMEIDNRIYNYPFDTYFKALWRKGYGAIYDLADILYNPYTIKSPIIITYPARVRLAYKTQIAGPLVLH